MSSEMAGTLGPQRNATGGKSCKPHFLSFEIFRLREVERYVEAADQERMARQGMAAIIKGRDLG